jgi:type IV pilus assembly protein PilB
MLVGEIRDAPSAITAVRAAAAGRFVLATLHARDAALAVEACQYFSVPRHLLGSTLRMIISQALVRRVCGECAELRAPTEKERGMFAAEGLEPPDRVPVPRGCATCHGFGYKGRIGIFEVVAFDRPMGDAVARGHGTDMLRGILAEKEAPSLRQDALSKVAEGITSIDEILNLHVPGQTKASTI